MEDTNGQDDTIESNDINEEDDSSYIEDSEEEDDYTSFDNKVYQKLQQNNPTITKVHVMLNCSTCSDDDQQYYFNLIDWENYGECISNNIHLKGLEIFYKRSHNQPYILGEEGNNLPTRQQLRAFFSCIYRNRSIEQLVIDDIRIVDEFGGGLIQGLCGHSSLTRLDIDLGYDAIDQSKLGSAGCTALNQVLKHPQSKLKDLRLPYCKPDDEGLGTLCDALLGNRIMKRLCLNGNDQITPAGWRALSTVIRHPNCKLVTLDLNDTGIDDKRADMLGCALRGSSVKALDLSHNRNISSDRINDDTGLARLAISKLASISTLKSLDLGSNKLIAPSGWQSFFNSLQRRGILLNKLDISFNRIGVVGAAALGGLLSNMSSLKTLKMYGISQNDHTITSQAWVSLFTTMRDSNLDLTRLDLGHNNIDDDSIQLLVPLLSRMTLLKHLSLSENEVATPNGWRALTRYLQSPNFAVEDLYLGNSNINDDTVVAFASALTHNKTLKVLDLFGCCDEDDNELITERGWGAFSALVCNKSSIMDTYNSNHTLIYVSNNGEEDNRLASYLELNYNKDKAEVARQKILQTHFSDTPKIQELLDMELQVLPTAVAWMGRRTYDDWSWSGKSVSGLSTVYNLMRRLPDLFDSSPQKQPSTGKRKRGSGIL